MNVPEFVHLNDIKRGGDSFYADVWLHRTQIDGQQAVSFRHPDGSNSQLNLTRRVREGSIIRLDGMGIEGRGQLILNVRLIDF